MNLHQRDILVPILGSELGVHTFEHQPVCRLTTPSYVQLLSLQKNSSNPSFFKGSDLWWGIFHRYVSWSAQFERLANFLGNEFMDTVTLGTLAIPGQSIGVATEVNSSGVIMTSNVLIFITITSRCF